MHTRTLLTLSILLLPALCAAQSVQASLSTLQPLQSASYIVGGTPDVATQPAGPLPAAGLIGTLSDDGMLFYADASLQWGAHTTSTSSSLSLECLAEVPAGGTGFALLGPQEFRVEFSATTATSVRCTVSVLQQVFGGAGRPLVQVDVGADGTIDWQDLAATGPVQFAFGDLQAAPLVLRILVDGCQVTSGMTHTIVNTVVEPADPIQVQEVAFGCAPDFQPTVRPLFGNAGVALGAQYFPSLTVIGFTPHLLPLASSVPNCFLLPSPDVVVQILPFQDLEVLLPQSVRPVLFFVQNVVVTSELFTQSAWSVFAW